MLQLQHRFAELLLRYLQAQLRLEDKNFQSAASGPVAGVASELLVSADARRISLLQLTVSSSSAQTGIVKRQKTKPTK